MMGGPGIPFRLRADYRYCREVVRSHHENFPVGSWLLPRRLRPHIHAVYAFARTADDFADSPRRTPAEKLMLLDDWGRRLELAFLGEPNHPIFRALGHTLHTTGLPLTPLQDLLTAFRMDVEKKRYLSLAELDTYCRHSANPVGRIVLYLADSATPENLAYSDAICTALQLTNHWQDLGQDLYAGRPLYLPGEEMERYGVVERDVATRVFSPALGDLVLDLVDRTRQLYLAGEPLIQRLPWPLNLEVAITWEAGILLLDRIEESGGNTLRVRPRLTPSDWSTCSWNALRRVLA